MKKNLKKKELEKVSGGHFCPLDPNYPSPRETSMPYKRVAPVGKFFKARVPDKPTGTNSEQTEGNPGELPLPK